MVEAQEGNDTYYMAQNGALLALEALVIAPSDEAALDMIRQTEFNEAAHRLESALAKLAMRAGVGERSAP